MNTRCALPSPNHPVFEAVARNRELYGLKNEHQATYHDNRKGFHFGDFNLYCSLQIDNANAWKVLIVTEPAMIS